MRTVYSIDISLETLYTVFTVFFELFVEFLSWRLRCRYTDFSAQYSQCGCAALFCCKKHCESFEKGAYCNSWLSKKLRYSKKTEERNVFYEQPIVGIFKRWKDGR